MSPRAPLLYHRAALTHCGQLVVIVLTTLMTLLTLSLVLSLVAFVLLEVLLVAFVPRLGLFRACVDRAELRRERDAAATAHAALLASMRNEHASELTTLERLAGEASSWWGTSAAAVERGLGIDDLLVTFGRLARSYHATSGAFTTEGRIALETEKARLDELPLADSDEWIQRRRAIVDLRRRTWMRASQNREVMLHALGTIAEVVRFIHELSTAASHDPGYEEIDRVLDDYTRALARVQALEVDAPPDRRETSTHVPLGPRPWPERPVPQKAPEPYAPPVPEPNAPPPIPEPPKPEPDRQPVPPAAPAEIPLRLLRCFQV